MCHKRIFSRKFINNIIIFCGPGLLSRYCDSLHAGRSGDRIPLEARFSVLSTPAPRPSQPSVQWVPGVSRVTVAGTCCGLPTSFQCRVENRFELCFRLPTVSALACNGVTALLYVNIITNCQPIESCGLEYLSLCVEHKYFMTELASALCHSFTERCNSDGWT